MLSLLREVAFFYNEIAIYLLLGFLVAGLLYVLFPESWVRRHLGRSTFLSVLKATAVGIPLPLCSCGVIPVAASLRKSGASRGATAAFLISTPQIGADSFLITYSLLGWVFALFRITASFVTAFFVGIAVNLTEKKGEAQNSLGRVSDPVYQETISERFRNLPSHILFNILGPIANALLVGLLVAGLITALIPEWIFEGYLGNGWLSMLLMLLIGIPMYVCASASTPIAASLVFKGLSPGAALVFLLTGPATNAVTIAAVTKSLGRRTAAIYLGGIAFFSLLMGAALNYAAAHFAWGGILHHHEHAEMLPAWLKLLGSLAIGMMLILYYLKAKLLAGNTKERTPAMKDKVILKVEGMTCQHCVSTVKKTVGAIQGVSEVEVDLAKGRLEFILGDASRLEEIKEAVRAAGYEV
jgi:uncharacterized protein